MGVVTGAGGGLVKARLPRAAIGAGVRIRSARGSIGGSIVAVDPADVCIAAYGGIAGVRAGDPVALDESAVDMPLGMALFGRAIDASGAPLDGKPLRTRLRRAQLCAPPAGERIALRDPLWCGVRVIDGLLAMARGARVGIFGAPGAGKSSLLHAIVRGTAADAVVVALTGERGREAEEWMRGAPRNATILCATSDRSAPERIRAAEAAMAQAAHLRSLGLHVLLLLDSFARYAAALREVAVAAGEPVGRAGFPASVFARMAQYAECAGAVCGGSVTLLASVLSDGDERDPVSDAARSLLDGHIELCSGLAGEGRYPAVDVLRSQSRTMGGAVSGGHARDAAAVRGAIAALARTADARSAGIACREPDVLRALACEAELEAFLRQAALPCPPEETLSQLAALADNLQVTSWTSSTTSPP